MKMGYYHTTVGDKTKADEETETEEIKIPSLYEALAKSSNEKVTEKFKEGRENVIKKCKEMKNLSEELSQEKWIRYYNDAKISDLKDYHDKGENNVKKIEKLKKDALAVFEKEVPVNQIIELKNTYICNMYLYEANIIS